MTTPLILGVPSKGRLQENTEAFFARAGFSLQQGRGNRDYRGRIAGLDGVEVQYLSAGEITARLANGALHLGVTGEDLVRERIPDADAAVDLVLPLGFGHADVVVAVPQAWIDVDTMADLDDISIAMRAGGGRVPRVATKYLNLARRYFSEHGLAEFRDYRLMESPGATEGAPAAGTADLIVDITTTGSTLRANALKVLSDGVILKSQANLVTSLRAAWSQPARLALEALLVQIEAEARARTSREIRLFADSDVIAEKAAVILGTALDYANGRREIVAQVKADDAVDRAAALRSIGARHISIRRFDYMFEAESPLVTRVLARLGATPPE